MITDATKRGGLRPSRGHASPERPRAGHVLPDDIRVPATPCGQGTAGGDVQRSDRGAAANAELDHDRRAPFLDVRGDRGAPAAGAGSAPARPYRVQGRLD